MWGQYTYIKRLCTTNFSKSKLSWSPKLINTVLRFTKDAAMRPMACLTDSLDPTPFWSYFMPDIAPLLLTRARLGLLITASTMPYSTASSAPMKKSLSVSMVTCSMVLPVNSAKYPFRVSLWWRISFAWISISAGASHQNTLSHQKGYSRLHLAVYTYLKEPDYAFDRMHWRRLTWWTNLVKFHSGPGQGKMNDIMQSM